MKSLLLCTVCILLLSCGPTVYIDYEENEDFSDYTTYQFYPDIASSLNEFDNKRFVNKSFVIINTHQIIEHCKNARFDYICYLVENCLGNTINTGLYIDSICQGIELLILSKRNMYLLKFENLKRHITFENMEVINKNIKYKFFCLIVYY